MKITKPLFPTNSRLYKTQYDYADCYQSIVPNNSGTIEPITVGKAFFSASPKWIQVLFNLRNRLVSVFGLKTTGKMENNDEILQNFTGSIGEQIGLFKVFDKSDSELILGEDDKHLDFRVSLLLERLEPTGQSLTISTTVQFNNWLGKLYFLPVKPFHQLIVPAMLKQIIKQLQK